MRLSWLYLATVIDCHTRQVIGWSMATHMRTRLICDALTMAAGRGDLQPNAIFDSDRGTQYTSAEFAAQPSPPNLRRLNLRGSMGRRGQCWDNALAESFFAALKSELVYRIVFATPEKAGRAVADYIETFYNLTRLHSGLGYDTQPKPKPPPDIIKLAPTPHSMLMATVRNKVSPSWKLRNALRATAGSFFVVLAVEAFGILQKLSSTVTATTDTCGARKLTRQRPRTQVAEAPHKARVRYDDLFGPELESR